MGYWSQYDLKRPVVSSSQALVLPGASLADIARRRFQQNEIAHTPERSATSCARAQLEAEAACSVGDILAAVAEHEREMIAKRT
jgi:hypothetical protein